MIKRRSGGIPDEKETDSRLILRSDTKFVVESWNITGIMLVI